MKLDRQFSIRSIMLGVVVFGILFALYRLRQDGLHQMRKGIAWAESIGGHASIVDQGRFFEDHVLRFNFEGSAISDKELARLAEFPDVRRVDLEKTAITDDAFVHLETLDNLEYLDLFQTAVTESGIASYVDKIGYLPRIRKPDGGTFMPTLAAEKSKAMR